jgi:hypothetical protein
MLKMLISCGQFECITESTDKWQLWAKSRRDVYAPRPTVTSIFCSVHSIELRNWWDELFGKTWFFVYLCYARFFLNLSVEIKFSIWSTFSRIRSILLAYYICFVQSIMNFRHTMWLTSLFLFTEIILSLRFYF